MYILLKSDGKTIVRKETYKAFMCLANYKVLEVNIISLWWWFTSFCVISYPPILVNYIQGDWISRRPSKEHKVGLEVENNRNFLFASYANSPSMIVSPFAKHFTFFWGRSCWIVRLPKSSFVYYMVQLESGWLENSDFDSYHMTEGLKHFRLQMMVTV